MRGLLVLLAGAAGALTTAALADPPRGQPQKFNVDPGSVSISGISSGADFAHQFHIAYSSLVLGVGLVAPSPYHCAKGSSDTATRYCTSYFQPYIGPPSAEYVDSLVSDTTTAFSKGQIDDPAGVRNAKIYLFSGQYDGTVPTPIVDTVYLFYTKLGTDPNNITYEKTIPAGHSMVTSDYGNECDTSFPPYINNCGFDTAGEIFKRIYGQDLAPRGTAIKANIVAFDQTPFFPNGEAIDLDSRGHFYVPTACKQGARCKLHVAFEGCQQNEDLIQDRYYTRAGYNEWAEVNNIIVMYPQVTWGFNNLLSCWDWWGYVSDDYYTKSSKQIAAVKAMIDRVLAGDALP
jgi:hypothetical protein